MENSSIEKKYYSLYSKIIDYNQYLRQYIVNNIPNIHRDIRIHLLDESYDLSKNMFSATYNKGNVRMKYLIALRVNLSLLDMLMSEIKNLNCIKEKTVNVSINKLSVIKNIIYGWIINEESKKK